MNSFVLNVKQGYLQCATNEIPTFSEKDSQTFLKFPAKNLLNTIDLSEILHACGTSNALQSPDTQICQSPFVVELSTSLELLCGLLWLNAGAVTQYGVASAIKFSMNAKCSRTKLQKCEKRNHLHREWRKNQWEAGTVMSQSELHAPQWVGLVQRRDGVVMWQGYCVQLLFCGVWETWAHWETFHSSLEVPGRLFFPTNYCFLQVGKPHFFVQSSCKKKKTTKKQNKRKNKQKKTLLPCSVCLYTAFVAVYLITFLAPAHA